MYFGLDMRFECSFWGLLSNNPHLFKIKKGGFASPVLI